jgi:4-amino-4-deoxy-L-arabinose transferase-like glycosyltransferase
LRTLLVSEVFRMSRSLRQAMAQMQLSRLMSLALTTRGVVSFWLLSGTAFVLMLWLVSPGRTLQDAEEAELMQRHLAGGYQLRDPPLYEWMLWATQQLIGSGPLSYLVLRYALIAAIGVLFYVAVNRTVTDRRLAAAFSLSLVLFFWFGWESHHSLAHSLALLAATLALWIAALAFAERSTTVGALGLGLVIGLGILSKWTFLLVVFCLGFAFAIVPATRRVYRDPLFLLVLDGAAIPLLPFIAWLFDFPPELLLARSLPSARGLPLEQTLQGAAVFLTGIPLIFLPWIVIVAAGALPLRIASSKPSRQDAVHLAALTASLLITLMALIFFALTLTGVALFGVARPFAVRYLFPFCLIAALAVAGFVANRVEVEPFARVLGAFALVASLAIFAIKLASFYVVPPSAEPTNLLPYARLAEVLDDRGLGAAQFITLSRSDAGNLNIYLPKARALSLSARIEPPTRDPIANRACVLVWGGESFVPPETPPASIAAGRFLKLLGLNGQEKLAEPVVVEWNKPLIGVQRRSIWYLLRGTSVESICRRLKVTGLLCSRSCPKRIESGELE